MSGTDSAPASAVDDRVRIVARRDGDRLITISVDGKPVAGMDPGIVAGWMELVARDGFVLVVED